MAGKAPRSRVGMFSRQTAIRRVDGRTREGRVIRLTIDQLVDQLGGADRITPAQALLIHSVAVATFRLRAALDAYAKGGDAETLDKRVCTLMNTQRLGLVTLGLARVDEQPQTLAAYLEGRKAA